MSFKINRAARRVLLARTSGEGLGWGRRYGVVLVSLVAWIVRAVL